MNTDIYGNLMTAMVMLALSAAVSPALAGRNRKLAGLINFIFVSISAIFLFKLSYAVIFEAAPQEATLITIGSYGIYFLVDSFSAFFIVIIAFMAVISSLYSIEYMEHYPEYSLRGYYFNLPVFIIGMIGLVTVDDLTVGFTIAWQLMTITSFFLIRFEFRVKKNVKSANKYLLLMQLAWLLIVGATLFIQGSVIGDSLHKLTDKLAYTSPAALYAVCGMLLLGFGFKAGIFPFGQLWLPDAHSVAPSPISALLSGVMLKTGIFGIVRTFYWMLPSGESHSSDGFFWGAVIAGFGVVTLFIGTVQSMKQSDAKRLLAYSSIGQIGYIVFALGASLIMMNSESGFLKMLSLLIIVGALYHVLNHAIFKGLLFLVSGSVLFATGTKDLNRLGGLLKIMPFTALAAGIASLSIAGVPPFSGFASKWTIISSSILAGSEIMFMAIFGIIALFTSAITLACYVKFFGMTFTSSGTEWTVKEEIKESPFTMLLPKGALAIVCIIQGLIPFVYFSAIITVFQKAKGSSIYESFNYAKFSDHITASMHGISVNVPGIDGIVSSTAVPAVIILVVGAAFLMSWFFKKSGGSTEREAETWLGGYTGLTDLNRYRDRSMFSSLKKLLWWTGGNVK